MVDTDGRTATISRRLLRVRQVPVPEIEISFYELFKSDGTILARVYACGSSVNSNQIPAAWQTLIAVGKETWFRPASPAPAFAAFKMQCMWRDTVGNLGTPPAWTSTWRNCGKDTVDASNGWVGYQANAYTKYTPDKVVANGAAEATSHIKTKFAVSFQAIDRSPAFVHWYRYNLGSTTPFVDGSGTAFTPIVDDYVTFESFTISGASWTMRMVDLT
jgi:hypothetical protein